MQQLAGDRVPLPLRDVGRQVIEVYHRGRFARDAVEPGRVRALESALRSLA